MRFGVRLDDQLLSVEVEERGSGFLVTIGEERFEIDARLPKEGTYSLLIDNASYLADLREEGGQLLVEIGGETYRLRVEEELRARLKGKVAPASRRGGQVIRAPMPGKVVSLLVRVGDQVAAGAGLIVIEAMKMENELRATAAGEVKEIRVAAGEAVITGQVLIIIE